jgi:pyruvate dehydrogenase E2 component (dihydrolipoamide acetyltransferase)
MDTEVKMPQLGETVVEGTITKWLKSEGDTVDQDELLVEISTDKVDSEVPSSASGTLQKILVQEGETVKVGTAIAVIGEDGEAGGAGGEAEEQPEAAAAGEQEEEKEPSGEQEEEEASREQKEEEAEPSGEQEEKESDEGEVAAKAQKEKADVAAEAEEASEEPDRAEEEPKQEGTAKETAGKERPAPAGDTSKRAIISPLVRRLADENNVDLDEVEGTGTGGRIRKQDVLRHIEERKARPAKKPAAEAEPAAEKARPAAAGDREELVPWTNIRRRTAEHMVASHLETARAWNAVEADWSDVVALREKAKKRFSEIEGFNLTYMPFLAKSVCETLLEMPEVNATYNEEKEGNVHKHYVNLGIAVALEGGGLIVPVVKGADEKNLVGLARAINDIVSRARAKKLSPDDLQGGTFTITNPGPFGSIVSVPIIPRGQAAIVGFEAIQKRVVVTKDDAIAIRSMGFLSMSWDHRAIDGAEAARWLSQLKESIEKTDFSSELAQYL